jgi:hypothetical protein
MEEKVPTVYIVEPERFKPKTNLPDPAFGFQLVTKPVVASRAAIPLLV